MNDLVRSHGAYLTGAHKAVLRAALRVAPEGRERDSILSLIDRVGMSDGQVAFSPAQAEYLRTNLMAHLALPALSGTKYDGQLAQGLAEEILQDLSAA